jgi:hypothetical protein
MDGAVPERGTERQENVRWTFIAKGQLPKSLEYLIFYDHKLKGMSSKCSPFGGSQKIKKTAFGALKAAFCGE